MNRKYIKSFWTLLFFCPINDLPAQDTALNKYGLWVIKNIQPYNSSIKNKPGKQLVNLKKLIPNLVVDLKYTSANNFTKQQLYPANTNAYIRREAAVAISLVQKELNKRELGLKIFDAYRPYSVTEKMWAIVKDDRYAADPKKGSGHNRGIAVDLTIIDLKTGTELDMGTGFDNFTDTAHQEFMALPKNILKNRQLLKSLMDAHGFKALATEWWHYSWANGQVFELLDIDINKLKK